MKVKVRLFGELERFLPKGSKGRSAVVELAEGSTALDLVELLGVPYQGHGGCLAIAVGDRVVEHGKPLNEGDVVTIFPPLAGGLHRAREMRYPLCGFTPGSSCRITTRKTRRVE